MDIGKLITSGRGDSFPADIYQQEFSVEFKYPVFFTKDIFNSANPLLATTIADPQTARKNRLLIYIDSGVSDALPDVSERISAYVEARSDSLELVASPETIPGGEKTKHSWNAVKAIMTSLGRHHMCRQSYVIVVGGGSVLDMVGFAASLVHRGLRVIRVPTTVLAQNDAGVGVKNGMDEHGMKNFVGTFAPPFAVLIDFNFLSSLDDYYWTGGIAEAFKVAIIKDSDLFEFLTANASKLRNRDDAAIEHLIRHTAILHLEHIRSSGDPFEFGTARPLDFGHWAAHKIEVLSDLKIGHGQAVSIGIALDSYYAAKTGLLNGDEFTRIIEAMLEVGLPVWDNLIERETGEGQLEILEGLEDFREHLGGRLTVTLPHHIGSKTEVHQMDTSIIRRGISFLRECQTEDRKSKLRARAKKHLTTP